MRRLTALVILVLAIAAPSATMPAIASVSTPGRVVDVHSDESRVVAHADGEAAWSPHPT